MATLTYFGFGQAGGNTPALTPTGLLSQRPDATVENEGSQYFATDDTAGSADGTLYLSVNGNWIIANGASVPYDLVVGTGAPTGGTGANGQMYLDKTNTNLYGPKTAGVWGDPFSLGQTEVPGGQVEVNTSAIVDLVADVATNTTSIATNASDIDDLQTDVATNTTDIATNTTDIVTLQTDLAAAESDIANHATSIADLEVLPYTSLDKSLPIHSLPGILKASDIVFGYSPHQTDDWLPVDGETFYAATGFQPAVAIDRTFDRLWAIESIQWVWDDPGLAAGGTAVTTGTSITTATAAPFAPGGQSNMEIGPLDMTALSSGVAHTLSALVTWKGGWKQTVPPITVWPFTSKASWTTYKNITSGSTMSVPRGVYDTNSTVDVGGAITRASRATLIADSGRVLLIGSTGPGISQTNIGSNSTNLSFFGPFGWIGAYCIRGDSILLDSAGMSPRPYGVVPNNLADGDEAQSRIFQLDGIGGTASNVVLRDYALLGSVADALFIARAQDVWIDRCTVRNIWDSTIGGQGHYDGLQTSGLLTSTGLYKSRQGKDAALLVTDCDIQGNVLLQPQLGASGWACFERTRIHDSNRTGIEVQNGVSGQPTYVWEGISFEDCQSYGHAHKDFVGTTVAGGATAATIEYYGSGLIYNNPDISRHQPRPPGAGPRVMMATDGRTPATGTGSSVAVTKPGITGLGDAVIMYLTVDAGITLTLPSGVTSAGNSGDVGGIRVYVLWWIYDGVTTSQTITFSASSGYALLVKSLKGTKESNPIESIAFASDPGTGGAVTTPSIKTQGRHRFATRVWCIGATASAGTWTAPTNLATVVNLVVMTATSATKSMILGYYPRSTQVPGFDDTLADLGALDCTYSQAGDGVGVSVVFAPEKLPDPHRISRPGLIALPHPNFPEGNVHLKNTLVNRPAATSVRPGTIFWADDQGTAYWSDGTTWTLILGNPWTSGGPNAQPDDGESVLDRMDVTTATVTATSQTLRLTYFRARRTEVITGARMFLAGTAAGATPTITRIGVWTATADGALTGLVASTANDTALLTGTTFQRKTKALSASWTKTRGQLYAAGLLVVSGATMPQLAGGFQAVTDEAGEDPQLYATVASQSDLPSTVAAGSITTGGSGYQFHFYR